MQRLASSQQPCHRRTVGAALSVAAPRAAASQRAGDDDGVVMNGLPGGDGTARARWFFVGSAEHLTLQSRTRMVEILLPASTGFAVLA